MSAIRNLPISRKFYGAFGIVCSLCIVLGAYTFLAFRGIAGNTVVVSGNHLPALIRIGDFRNAVSTLRSEDLELLLCQTPACTAAHGARRKQAVADYQEALDAMQALILPEERGQYQQFVNSIQTYQAASDRAAALEASAKIGDALDLLSADATTGALNAALKAADQLFQHHEKLASDKAQSASDSSSRATWIDLAVTLLIVALCALVGVWTDAVDCAAHSAGDGGAGKAGVKGPDGGAASIGERRDRSIGRRAEYQCSGAQGSDRVSGQGSGNALERD